MFDSLLGVVDESFNAAAAEATSQDSREIVLALQQEFEKQRLGLNKILGVGRETHARLRPGSWFSRTAIIFQWLLHLIKYDSHAASHRGMFG